MRVWREVPGERIRLHSPFGLHLVDGVTGYAPIGLLSLSLARRDGAEWVPVDARPMFTPSSVAGYPGLGRTRDPLSKPPQRHRVRIDAEYYRAQYSPPAEGFEFDVFPYDDANPPASIAGVTDVILAPAPHYPFEPQVAVIHGVVSAGGKPAVDAVVTAPGAVLALTDERGAFSLALLRSSAVESLNVTVTPRSGASVLQNVTLPSVLNQSLKILLP